MKKTSSIYRNHTKSLNSCISRKLVFISSIKTEVYVGANFYFVFNFLTHTHRQTQTHKHTHAHTHAYAHNWCLVQMAIQDMNQTLRSDVFENTALSLIWKTLLLVLVVMPYVCLGASTLSLCLINFDLLLNRLFPLYELI